MSFVLSRGAPCKARNDVTRPKKPFAQNLFSCVDLHKCRSMRIQTATKYIFIKKL